jgi:DNA-binding response OmpR family regulator
LYFKGISVQPRILSVDDAPDHQLIVGRLFVRDYSIITAFTLEEADLELGRGTFDLILLDVNLPDGDGFSYFAKLRAQDHTRDIPVIFVTISGEMSHEVTGLSLGAEDYIVKPIDPARTRARVDARLKNLRQRREGEMVLQRGNLKLSVSLQRVTLIIEGKEHPIGVTPVEFKLLFYFFRHEDHAFTREQLRSAVWGNASEVFDRTVDMHVSNLRKKIIGSDYKIQAVQGIGYRFTKG